ncbi:MAG: hypothetical protein LC657_13415, partial [Desulfobacteraceae bacterium]|nr:hypothetical protein [Desulfobacteraceae bacterium]
MKTTIISMKKSGAGYRVNRIRLAVILGPLVFILAATCLTTAGRISAGTHYYLSTGTQHYQDQVAFISEQIRQIQSDLDWLTRKVARMQDFNQFVPRRMQDSIAFKRFKIGSLEKLKKRYQDLIQEQPGHRSQYQDTRENAREKAGDTLTIGDGVVTGNASGSGDNFRQNLENQLAALGLDNWLELVPNTTPVCLETRLPILFASASAEIPKGYDAFFK